MGQLHDIFSEGISAQDRNEGNLAVVQNVFSRAAELAENVSYSEGVSELFALLCPSAFIYNFLAIIHIALRSIIVMESLSHGARCLWHVRSSL